MKEELTPLQSPHQLAGLTASQLRRRYIVALSLIALLVLISQIVMQLLIAGQEHDSRIVNIAGRQRMLSQNIAKTALYITTATTAEAARSHRQQLRATLELWRRSHQALQHGDTSLGLPGGNSAAVRQLFSALDEHYQQIVLATERLTHADNTTDHAAALAVIRTAEPAFLKGMDAIVFRYDAEARERVEFARWLEIGLMSITLLVLVLEARFIFAPATRRIQRDMALMAEREQDMEHMFAASPTALILVNPSKLSIVRSNCRTTELTGFPVAQLKNKSLQDLVDGAYEINHSFLERVRMGAHLSEYEVVLLDAKNATVESLVSVREIGIAGEQLLILGFTNISEIKRAEKTLQYYATFDELTELFNRRTGLVMLEKAVARARRGGEPLTVVFGDVDGLKSANDTYGHQEGDWLIRTVAQVLFDSIRDSDSAVRLGGDEFLLILPDLSAATAATITARIRARLDDIRHQETKDYPLGISFGIVTYAADQHATANELLAAADRAMYEDKTARKLQAITAQF